MKGMHWQNIVKTAVVQRRHSAGIPKADFCSNRSILPIATKCGQWFDIIISQKRAKFHLDTGHRRVARCI